MSIADGFAVHTKPEERPDWQQADGQKPDWWQSVERWRVREDIPVGWKKVVPIVRVKAGSARAQ